jgi:uncharacterized membrane protein YeaQ/YmgE (transglycosylase-associated protein family)
MSFLAWIIAGGIAGWLASLLTNSKQSGCLTNIIVGMVGSIIGGSLLILFQTGRLDFTNAFTDFNLTSILVSTFGAIVLIVLLRMFSK